MKTLIAAVAFTGALLTAQAASAASYNFSFSGTTLSGVFNTSSSGATQLITSITGTYNGNSISLLPTGTSPTPTNDNLLYTAMNGTGYITGTSGYLDAGGVEFKSGNGTYNLFYNTSSSTTGYYITPNSGGGSFSQGNLTVTAVAVSAAPEPGAWALMLGGVGVIGAMLRVAQARRREDELKSIATA